MYQRTVHVSVACLGTLGMIFAGAGCKSRGPVCVEAPAEPGGLELQTQSEGRPVDREAMLLEEAGNSIALGLQSRLEGGSDGSGVTPMVAAARQINVLALSGGGQLGSFGVGILDGWEDRPDFDLVTGVSTGSLISTFAFIGDDRSIERLVQVYGNTTASQIYTHRGLLSLPKSSSLADTKPLRRQLESEIDEGVLRRVAAKADEGGVLLIGAVSLEWGLFLPFELSKIAQSYRDAMDAGDGDTAGQWRDYYISAVMASASIPVAFPPTCIKGDVPWGELWIDGGTRQNVFLPACLEGVEDAVRSRPGSRVNVYVIVNEHIAAPVKFDVEDRVFPIAGRAINLLFAEAQLGALCRMAYMAEEKGWNFRVTSLDSVLACDPGECPSTGLLPQFCQPYMRCLIDAGRDLQRDGRAFGPWECPQTP